MKVTVTAHALAKACERILITLKPLVAEEDARISEQSKPRTFLWFFTMPPAYPSPRFYAAKQYNIRNLQAIALYKRPDTQFEMTVEEIGDLAQYLTPYEPGASDRI